MAPVVRVTGNGIKNVRAGREEERKKGEGEKGKNEERVEVRVGVGEGKTKLRRVGEGVAVEKVTMAEEVVEGGARVKADVRVQGDVRAEVKVQQAGYGLNVTSHHAAQEREVQRFIPSYKSLVEDRNWAEKGMVASVFEGDSTLSLQQRIEDAGFKTVVVTSMGGDRVFLTCTGGEDIWHVFNNALHFFGMLFYKLHKWSMADVQYERGAWLRIYGVPVQAWNVAFFKLWILEDLFVSTTVRRIRPG